MKPRQIVKLAALLLLVCVALPPATQAEVEPPAPPDNLTPLGAQGAVIRSLSGSYVVFDPSVGGDACYIPGSAGTFCFRAESFTTDWEYVYNVWQKLPVDWTVSNAYLVGTPSCTGGGTWGTFQWSFETSPYEVNVYHPRYQATNDHCLAYYCFDVVAGTGPMDAGVAWYWDGDDYNNAPHAPCSSPGYTPPSMVAEPCDEMINPEAVVPVCNIEPGVHLMPESQEGSGCEGDTVEYGLSLYNDTGAAANFAITYAALWDADGPATLYAAQGATVDFAVSVDIPCGGDSDDATVTATGNGYSDSAALHTFFDPTGGWNAEDADLGTLPSAMWGMGYAQTADRLWLVAGIQSGVISAASHYYNLAAGAWVTDGNLATGAVYRTSATVVDGVLYKLGGSTGSFNYTGLADKYVGGWSAIATEPNNGRMDNVVAGYDGFAWSIAGYGADANVRKYDPATNTWSDVGTPAPFGAANYARSGCTMGNKVYLYGDATGAMTGLWRYDMGTGAWAQVTPTGTPPAQNAIWAPAWVGDTATGLCYLTGGATTPGTGNLTTVYVYDSVNNMWLDPLPEFTTARDFHAAFLFTRLSDGHKLLCVAGGSNGEVGLTSTQCLDLAGCGPCPAPTAPVLSPIANSDGDGSYSVAWSESPNALTYTLQEDDNSGFTSPTVRYTGPNLQFQVTGQPSGTWYYRVRASNDAGSSLWSNVQSTGVKPGVPTLLPIDNPNHDDSYLVDWNSVQGATGYNLREDDDPAFGSPVTRYTGANTYFQVVGQPGGTWYYQVRANNAAGSSAWSSSRSTTVQAQSSSLYLPAIMRDLAVDFCEPNNNFETSCSLASGQVVFAFLSANDRSDYYAVILPANHGLRIQLQQIPTGDDYDLYLYDESHVFLVQSANPGNSNEEIYWPNALANKAYFIRVVYISGPVSAQPYRLVATFQ